MLQSRPCAMRPARLGREPGAIGARVGWASSTILVRATVKGDSAMYEGLLAETISHQGHNGDEIEAYFARPLGLASSPGVVVIHHMPGWDEATKEITRKFAHRGYAAICPNLHYREAPTASPDDASAAVR